MTRLHNICASLALLQAVTAYAAPNPLTALAHLLHPRQQPATSIPLANSFTSANSSTASSSATSSSASPSPTVLALGVFTGADEGIYSVTSQSGYYVIDGKTLGLGQGALIGNEQVDDVNGTLIANGQTVSLTPSTVAAVATTTTDAASSSGTSGSGSAVSGFSAATTTAASSAGTSAAAAATSSKASSASAVGVSVSGGVVGTIVAAAGGVFAALLLL